MSEGFPRGETHYIVAGGPMMVICHSKTLESSMRPAEKPSMGFRLSSAAAGAGWVGTSESREGPEDEERRGVEGE